MSGMSGVRLRGSGVLAHAMAGYSSANAKVFHTVGTPLQHYDAGWYRLASNPFALLRHQVEDPWAAIRLYRRLLGVPFPSTPAPPDVVLGALYGGLDAARRRHVVVLDHHHVVQPHAVVGAAADQHRPLVQHAQAWRQGLRGVVDRETRGKHIDGRGVGGVLGDTK